MAHLFLFSPAARNAIAIACFFGLPCLRSMAMFFATTAFVCFFISPDFHLWARIYSPPFSLVDLFGNLRWIFFSDDVAALLTLRGIPDPSFYPFPVEQLCAAEDIPFIESADHKQ